MPVVINLSTLNGTNGFTVKGKTAYDNAGFSVASAGDVNGDGFGDFIIGAPQAEGPGGQNEYNFGAGYVVFGKAGGFGTEFDLSSLNGANGFTIFGEGGGDYAGWSVAGAGDINGDGVGDLIIGAPAADSSNFDSGSSYVVFGKTTGFSAEINVSSLDGANGFQFAGSSVFEKSGSSVASAGDLNGDGIDDLIIGSPRMEGVDEDFTIDRGGSYVLFGSNAGFDANLDLSSLDGTNGFLVTGEAIGDYSGGSVASAGDVNGDGFDDLIIGAVGVGSTNFYNNGASYIIFGKASGFAANLNLSSLNGSNGFKITGIGPSDSSGESVASAGDVNGDGIDDIFIGANSGACYVVFGKSTGFSSNFNLKTLNGANGFVLSGWESAGGYGIPVASAGDFNGDGIGDLIVGVSGINSNGYYQTGASYLMFGKKGGFGENIDITKLGIDDGFQIVGSAPFGNSGKSVASAGDINGDGFDDLIIGAPAESAKGTQSGAAYILFGHAKMPNSAPEGADNTIVLYGKSSHAFTAADFGYSDQDGNELHSIIISTLPANGILSLKGSTVAAGKEILVDAVSDLIWTAAKNDSGPGKGSFTFQVVDDGGIADGGQNKDQSPNTISFNVIADDYADHAGTTGIVKVDGNPVSGEIEYAGDVDLFKVALQSGKAYVFDLVSTSEIDPTLMLYYDDFHDVDIIATDDDGGSGANARIAFFANNSGTYYLGAKSFDGKELGTYEISAMIVEDDYTDDFDTTSGFVIVGGAATNGEIQFQEDVDLFKINLQAGKTYVFDLAETSGIDTRLELYDTDFYFIFGDEDGGPGNNSRITFTANQTGTYFLSASSSYPTDIGGYKIEAQLYMKPGNHAPALIGDAAILEKGYEDSKYKISVADLLAGYNDEDGDSLSIYGLTSNHGTISDNYGGGFTMRPSKDYQGAVTLSYVVVDGNGGSVEATSIVNLADVTDFRNGHRGKDNLVGTSGHDILNAKAGNDQLTGKAGSDTFIFWKNYDRDVIKDFDAVGSNHDILNLKNLDSVRNFQDLMANHIAEKHGNVVIDGLHGDIITLKGVDLGDLDKGDFIF